MPRYKAVFSDPPSTELISGMLPPPTWTSPVLTVRQSSIPNAGNGVFATAPIKANCRLADYIGDRRLTSEYKKSNCSYFYSLGHTVLDGKPYLSHNVSHYINESKTPNVYLRRRGLYALRDILVDEELFLTYPEYTTRNYTPA